MTLAVRQQDSSNRLWFETLGTNTMIGFTKPFLEIVNSSWHVLQNGVGSVKKDAPLLSVETDDALFAVPSPLDGEIITFSDKAQNYPDKLTEDDVVCIVSSLPAQKAKKAPARKLPERMILDDDLLALLQVEEPVLPNPNPNNHIGSIWATSGIPALPIRHQEFADWANGPVPSPAVATEGSF